MKSAPFLATLLLTFPAPVGRAISVTWYATPASAFDPPGSAATARTSAAVPPPSGPVTGPKQLALIRVSGSNGGGYRGGDGPGREHRYLEGPTLLAWSGSRHGC
jgi:hypothetical protein